MSFVCKVKMFIDLEEIGGGRLEEEIMENEEEEQKKRKEKGEPDESERKDEGRRRRRRKSQRLATVNECLSIYSCITLDFLFVNIKCHPNNLPTFLLRFCPFILTYWNIEVLHFLCQLFILVLCWKSLFLLCLLSPFR